MGFINFEILRKNSKKFKVHALSICFMTEVCSYLFHQKQHICKTTEKGWNRVYYIRIYILI